MHDIFNYLLWLRYSLKETILFYYSVSCLKCYRHTLLIENKKMITCYLGYLKLLIYDAYCLGAV